MNVYTQSGPVCVHLFLSLRKCYFIRVPGTMKLIVTLSFPSSCNLYFKIFLIQTAIRNYVDNTSRYSLYRQSAFWSSCLLKICRFFRLSTVNSTSETENNKISRIWGPIHSTSTSFLFIITIMVSYEYHTIP